MQNTQDEVREWTIYYKYKRKLESTYTKPCTHAQALQAFNKELNSFGSFTLVRIVPR